MPTTEKQRAACKRYYESKKGQARYAVNRRRPEVLQAEREKSWRHNGIDFSWNRFEEMFLDQDGRCAICSSSFLMMSKNRNESACVDHDHKTGAVRGLLCQSCNRGLGAFEEKEEFLENALSYMKKMRK